MRNTLNRKYLMQAIDASLERFGLDFVDVLYCHRADPNTPIEETVWAMSDIITAGQGALLGHERVVGRRDPRGDRHRRAASPAQAGHRAEPVQPARAQEGRAGVRPDQRRVQLRQHDLEPARLRPADRQVQRRHPRRLPCGARRATSWLAGRLTDAEAIARVEKLRPIADRLGCTMAQLALAWCTKNPHVSTRDHRRVEGQPGRAELRDRRRDPAPHRRGERGDGGRRQGLSQSATFRSTSRGDGRRGVDVDPRRVVGHWDDDMSIVRSHRASRRRSVRSRPAG